jgi:hypothetical protein
VNEEQNEDLTNNTITTEGVIQEGNEITEELSLKEVRLYVLTFYLKYRWWLEAY